MAGKSSANGRHYRQYREALIRQCGISPDPHTLDVIDSAVSVRFKIDQLEREARLPATAEQQLAQYRQRLHQLLSELKAMQLRAHIAHAKAGDRNAPQHS